MAIILRGAGPAPAAPSPVAFSTIIEACLEEMSDDPQIVTGLTTAAGDADSLVDTTNLKETSSAADANRYDGQWVRLTISGVENIRKVKSYAPSTGTIVPEASFSGAPGTGNTYEIHQLLTPARLKQAICDSLAELRYQEILPLTLVVDGDMIGSAAATYWGTSNATIDYDTTYVLFGTRSLYVAATVADGYAYPKTNVAVTPGETLIVWAPAYSDEKGAKLALYDVTAGADIETARHDEEGFGLLFFTCTVPEDCYEVRPHLQTITNGGTTYWDHVGILKVREKVYDSPTWLTKDQDVIKIVSFALGMALTSDDADNAYSLWASGPQHEHLLQTIPAHRGIVPLRLELGTKPNKPLFVVGKRRYPPLSADSDETTADEATVKAGALAFAFRRLGDDYAGKAAQWAYIFNGLRRGDEPPLTVRQRSCWSG